MVLCYDNLSTAYSVLAHRIGEALGTPCARDESNFDLGESELCSGRCEDHITLLERVSQEARQGMLARETLP